MRFEWHPQKANANIKKQGVDFHEAMTVFEDPFALIREDTLHLDTELREIALGYSNQQRLLTVCFVERKNTNIRLISARPATNQEQQQYEQQNRFTRH